MAEANSDQFFTPQVVSLQTNLKATLDGWSEKRTYYSRKLKGGRVEGEKTSSSDSSSNSLLVPVSNLVPQQQCTENTTNTSEYNASARRELRDIVKRRENIETNNNNTTIKAVTFGGKVMPVSGLIAKDGKIPISSSEGDDDATGDRGALAETDVPSFQEAANVKRNDVAVPKVRARKSPVIKPPKIVINGVSDVTGVERGPSRSKVQPNSSGTSDMDALKEMATRLNLRTRRPSYVEWQQKYLESSQPELSYCSKTERQSDRVWSDDKKAEIDEALSKIRKDLIEMRLSDHRLARQLMNLRREIHQVKLQHSSAQHKVVLEEAFDQMQDEHDEIAEVCDLPPDQFSPTLKHFGVTRMNLSTRRFSVF